MMASTTPFFLLLVSLLLSSFVVAEDLHTWKVVRAELTTQENVDILSEWELDVWSYDSNLVIGKNDIRVSEEQLVALQKLSISYEVLVNDVQVMLDEMAKDAVANQTAADWFVSYHTFDQYVAYLNNLTSSYPTLMKKSTIGTSVEGRNIDAYVLTGTGSGSKQKIMFTGCQHAREWVSPATVVYVLTNLVTLYGRDTSVKRILDNVQFHIVPIFNPDGYVYSWGGSSTRLWRKNRRRNSGGSYGVDLNRNWNDHWGGAGSSGSPTSDTYRGTAPFSEPESKAVSSYMTANSPFAAYIDFHAYSQLVLRPYGWTSALPPNSAVQKTVADGMASAIKSVHGKVYQSIPSINLYATTGTSTDWAYSEAHIILPYCIELRDTGTYGFQLPANQIIPTGQENWAAVKYLANYVIDH